MFGVTLEACADAITVASGFSSGASATAVSIFSVLAGRSRPCGSLAARTWPVPASATTYADAGTLGSGAAGPFTITPLPASCAPPTVAGLAGSALACRSSAAAAACC